MAGIYTCIKSWKKICIKSDFKEISLKLATNELNDKAFLLTSKLCPLKAVCPCPRAIYMYKIMKKFYKISFNEIILKLATNDQSDKMFLLISNFVPKGLSAPAMGLYTCMKSWKKNYIKSDFKEIFLKLVANDRSDKRFLMNIKVSFIHVTGCAQNGNAEEGTRYSCHVITMWQKCSLLEICSLFMQYLFCWHQNLVPWGCLPLILFKLATNDHSDEAFLLT